MWATRSRWEGGACRIPRRGHSSILLIRSRLRLPGGVRDSLYLFFLIIIFIWRPILMNLFQPGLSCKTSLCLSSPEIIFLPSAHLGRWEDLFEDKALGIYQLHGHVTLRSGDLDTCHRIWIIAPVVVVLPWWTEKETNTWLTWNFVSLLVTVQTCAVLTGPHRAAELWLSLCWADSTHPLSSQVPPRKQGQPTIKSIAWQSQVQKCFTGQSLGLWN